MNEELHLLLGMMNGEGEGENRPIAGSQVAGDRDITPPQHEVEITDDLRERYPVVNNARNGGNRLNGVTNFLANPEVQNALISFGQSYSNAGNYTGQPNPVDAIGEAGRETITANANQQALEAFERGEPVAESAGRFANPELVAGLQERRQQQEQFQEQMEFQAEELDVRRSQIDNDAIMQKAQLDLDEEVAQSRAEQMQAQQELEEKVAESRISYYEAQAEAMSEEAEGDPESLALRSNEFLEMLDEREQSLEEEITVLEDTAEDARAEASGLSTMEVLREEFSDVLDPLTTQELQRVQESRRDENPIVRQAENQLEEARNRMESLRAERQAIQEAQSARLGGQPSADRQEQEEGDTPDISPEGSWDSPVSVSSQADLRQRPDGSVVQFGDQTYMWRDGRLFTRDQVEGGEQ